MEVGRLLGAFVAQPLLALVPATALIFMFARCRRRIVLVAAIAWLAYVPYELAMKLRVLCSGECNIRVDLLLLYPTLAFLLLTGVFAYVRTSRGQTRA
jgi:hypothetical protein